ncbi:MAG: DUF3048 domain-containing protein [Candidatus Nanopelagicaceae bacterium]|nr:DUF3048 domain-containing protein [Candidatus Nanopelagicaceae bacterium]
MRVAIVAAVLLLSSCQSTNKASDGSGGPSSAKTIITYNSLSGRVGTDGPVLVVKIDDTYQAHPQIGLDQADVVYIEQVEGGLTRLAAVFSSVIPDQIGPVRSARISDIDILAQYGHVAFAYSGAQSKLLPVIHAANLQDLGAQRESPTIYVRDETRYAPVNLILQAGLLMAKLKDESVPIDVSKNMGWNFALAAPLGGNHIISVKVKWPANSYTATWSSTQSRWLLYQNDKPDLAVDGRQLGPTTFVIQMVSITPSAYHDKFGGVTPFSATVGQGDGFILRDGTSYPAKWNRPSATSGTTWTQIDGSPLPFAPGQIWVALTNTAPVFALPTPTAASPTSASPTPTK